VHRNRLSRKTKILYGIGDTSFSLTTTIVGVYLAIFLTDVVGVSPGIAAVAIFVGRSWDYINDPLVGYISDRTRTRWGRRRPFLLFGMLPFAVTFSFLWWRAPWKSSLVLAIYYSAVYVVFDTATTCVEMPYNALTPELTSNYDERTSLTTYRMFFSIVAGLIAFTLPLTIVGSFRPENAPRVFTMGALFGLFCALPLLITFLGTEENKTYMRQEQTRLLPSLQAALKNRPFLYSVGIFLFTWVTVDILQTTLLYFFKYCLLREAQSDWMMGIIFGAAIVSLPLWSWVSRILGKRWAYICGVFFWASLQLVIASLGTAANLPLLIVLFAFAGLGVGAAHVLTWAIIPDSIEWDEWKTGSRHEGVFYSIVILTKKIASSVAIPLALLLLESSGYRPNVPGQSDRTLRAIRLLVGVLPAVLLCLGIVLAFLYPLTKKRYAEICQELEERRFKKGG
jgi:GPH family glycoside/pentoside/hexuronide:cation symporter